MKNLPEELVIQILLKLAVRDLLRCKDVCKSWFSIINTPSFIHQHLEVRKKINSNPYFLVNSRNDSDWDETKNYNTIYIVSHQTLGVFETHQFTFNPIYIAGSYNGIVCLSKLNRNNDILLWNPATSHTKYVTNWYQAHHNSSYLGLGFGFDPKNNDYKVVSIKIPYNHYSALRSKLPLFHFEVMVYSLKTGSWTRIPNEKLAINSITGGICTEGMYSWMAMREIKQGIRVVMEDVILSFDMTNEVLISTPLPSIIDKPHTCCPTAYKESLSVIISYGFGKEYDVWMLGEYGVKESWTQQFSVRSNEIEWPMGLRNNPLQLLAVKYIFPRRVLVEDLLVLFDPITKQTNSFPIFAYGNAVKQLGINFTESLVPISEKV